MNDPEKMREEIAEIESMSSRPPPKPPGWSMFFFSRLAISLWLLFFVAVWEIYLQITFVPDPIAIEAKELAHKAYPPHPDRLQKITSKTVGLDIVQANLATPHTRTQMLGWIIMHYFPYRYVHLENVGPSYAIPRYLRPILSDKKIKSAHCIEILYYDDIHVRYSIVQGHVVPDKVQPPNEDIDVGFGPHNYYMGPDYYNHFSPFTRYFTVVGITVDGVTYLTPTLHKIISYSWWYFLIIIICDIIYQIGFKGPYSIYGRRHLKFPDGVDATFKGKLYD